MAHFGIGLTGGIASGKSVADRAFAALGVPVLDADALSRELVEPGQPALDEIRARFGAEVLQADGRLDRPALRQRVFADDDARRALEAILHPRIRAELQRRSAEAPGDLVVASIPLLAEGGGREAYPMLARILVIDVAPETQLARLMQRDGIDMTLARQMIGAQASREERLAIADDILRNEGRIEDLQACVAELVAFYRRLAAESRP